MAETAQNELRIRLVTPDHVFIDGTASAVELPARSGSLEALYGHAPLLTELGAGEVRLHGGSVGERRYFVAWGFAEVLPERVTILAESVTAPDAIDTAAAQRELERGQKLWQEAGAEAKLYREANRIQQEAEARLAAAAGAAVRN